MTFQTLLTINEIVTLIFEFCLINVKGFNVTLEA